VNPWREMAFADVKRELELVDERFESGSNDKTPKVGMPSSPSLSSPIASGSASSSPSTNYRVGTMRAEDKWAVQACIWAGAAKERSVSAVSFPGFGLLADGLAMEALVGEKSFNAGRSCRAVSVERLKTVNIPSTSWAKLPQTNPAGTVLPCSRCSLCARLFMLIGLLFGPVPRDSLAVQCFSDWARAYLPLRPFLLDVIDTSPWGECVFAAKKHCQETSIGTSSLAQKDQSFSFMCGSHAGLDEKSCAGGDPAGAT